MARTDNVQINLNINGSRAISELNLLQSEAGKLRESMKGLKRGTEEYAKLDGQLKEVTKAMKAQQDQLGLNGMTIAQLTYKKNQLAADIRKNLVPATDEYIKKTAELQKVNARLTELRGSVQQVGSVWDQLKSRFALTFDVGSMLAKGFDMLASSLRAVVGIAATLSDKFADIQKSTGMSAKGVGIFANTLQQMDTRTSLEGLLDIAKVGGQFGIAQKDLLAFTDTIDKVNVALGDELKGGTEEVTKVLGGLRNIFTDIKTKNVGNDILHIGNAINKLGAEGAATGDVIADFSNRIGGVGITMDLTSGQVLGISAAMQEMNINAERGATAFTRILQEMAQAPDAFAQVAGKSSAEFKKLVNTNIYEAFKLVAQGANASSAQATVFAQVLKKLDIDGAGASEVIAKLGGNVQLMDTRVKSATEGVKDASSVMGEFGIKNETTAANLEKFSKAMYNIGVFFGTIFGNAVNVVSQNLASFLGWLRKVPEVTNPAIEATKRERNELQYLLAAIKNNNTSNEARIGLVKELQQKYPDLSAKVGEFTDKTGKLTVNEKLLNQAVKDTNSEYDRRIFILSKQEVEQRYQSQFAKSIQEEIDLQKALAEQIAKGADKTKMQRELASGGSVEYTVDATVGTKNRIAAELKLRDGLLKDREKTLKALSDIAKRQGIDINKIDQEQSATKLQQQNQLQANQLHSQADYEKEAKRLRDEAEQKRKEAREKSLEADKAFEDLRIATIQDSFDKEIAETELATKRKIDESNKEFAFIKANAQYNQGELAVKTQEHNDYLTLLEQQKNDKIAQLTAKKKESELKAQEEQNKQNEEQAKESLTFVLDSIDKEAKEKEEKLRKNFEKEQKQRLFELDASNTLDWQKYAETADAERNHQEDIWQIREDAIRKKLERLAELNMLESQEARALSQELIDIETDKNDRLLEQEKIRNEGAKTLREQAWQTTQSILQFGIDSENSFADSRIKAVKDEWDKKIESMRKGGKTSNEVIAQAEAERDAQISAINKNRIESEKRLKQLKAVIDIAEVLRNSIVEIQGYFKAYSDIPGGSIIAAGLAGFAGIRAGIAIAKIKQSAKVESYAIGGMIKNNGVLPSNTTHAQGGLHVVDSRSGRKVAEFEGQEGVIFSKAAIKNNPHLWQPLLYSSQYMGGAPASVGQARQYQNGGVFGGNQASASVSGLPADMGTANALMQKIDMLLNKIDSKSDVFKKVYLSYFDLEKIAEQVQRRRAENSSQ